MWLELGGGEARAVGGCADFRRWAPGRLDELERAEAEAEAAGRRAVGWASKPGHVAQVCKSPPGPRGAVSKMRPVTRVLLFFSFSPNFFALCFAAAVAASRW